MELATSPHWCYQYSTHHTTCSIDASACCAVMVKVTEGEIALELQRVMDQAFPNWGIQKVSFPHWREKNRHVFPFIFGSLMMCLHWGEKRPALWLRSISMWNHPGAAMPLCWCCGLVSEADRGWVMLQFCDQGQQSIFDCSPHCNLWTWNMAAGSIGVRMGLLLEMTHPSLHWKGILLSEICLQLEYVTCPALSWGLSPSHTSWVVLETDADVSHTEGEVVEALWQMWQH